MSAAWAGNQAVPVFLSRAWSTWRWLLSIIPESNRQTQGQCAGIIQCVQPIGRVAMPLAHRGVVVQGGHDLGRRPTFESLLLRPSPLIGRAGPAHRRRCSRVFADVKEVAQKVRLLPGHFPALHLDPLRTVTHRVDAAVQSPAARPRDVRRADCTAAHNLSCFAMSNVQNLSVRQNARFCAGFKNEMFQRLD